MVTSYKNYINLLLKLVILSDVDISVRHKTFIDESGAPSR